MVAHEQRSVHPALSAGIKRYPVRPPEGDARVAWGLFVFFGLPLALMGMLVILAHVGIYIDAFKPLWLPWPPEALKPFLGIGGFAATLAYLAYRVGRRTGFRSGTLAGIASARNLSEAREREAEKETPPPPPSPEEPTVVVQPVPPPPADPSADAGNPADDDLSLEPRPQS